MGGRSMRKRHPQNAPGDWYVDTRCIDCGAARTAAPGLIVERDGQSVFARQPQTADERMMAWRARLLCRPLRCGPKAMLGCPMAYFRSR